MRDLLKFEIGLQLRGVGFWLAVAALFVFGLSATSLEWFTIAGDTGQRIKANSPLVLSVLGAFAGLGAVFFAGVFTVNGTMRDDTHKFLEIIHATPVSTRAMAWSRIAGVALATWIASSAILAGAWAGTFMPWADAQALGPFRADGYLFALVVVTGLNALLLCALFGTIAGITRSRMAVYIGAVAAFLVYLAADILGTPDVPKWIRAIIDPLSGGLELDSEFWSPDEQNTRLPPLSGWFGLNRLVWGGATLAGLAGVLALFRRGIATRTRRRRGLGRADVEAAETAATSHAYRPVTARGGTGAALAAFWARLRLEYLQTVRSVPFIVLVLLMFALSGTTLAIIFSDFIADRTLPTNSVIAEAAFGGALLPLLIILAFFSAETVWREKTAGISELVDYTRAPSAALLAGKWLAMIAVIITLLSAIMGFGMVAQMIVGNVPVVVATHLANAAAPVPRLAILAFLILFLQNVMPNRVVGLLSGGAAVVLIVIVLPFTPFYHPVIDFGRVSLGRFSEISGFSNLYQTGWFALYWGGAAVVLAVLSAWLWRRGTQDSVRDRLLGWRGQLGPATTALMVAGLVGLVFGGVSVSRAYGEANFRTSAQMERLQVEYERRFADRFDMPLPKIRSVDTDVTFRTEAQTAEISGTYVVENASGAPLEEMYVTYDENDLKRGVDFRIDNAILVDDPDLLEFGVVRAVFDPPVPPGARFDFDFDIDIVEPTLADDSPLRLNGTFINNSRLFPTLGLSPLGRLSNPDKRRKYGLPELLDLPDQTDMRARTYNFFDPASDEVTFQTRFCTSPGQIPIAPGDLIREYDRNGLACREYRASRPIANFFAFTSGDYAVAEDVWTGPDGRQVDLSIFYDAQHDYNIELMLAAMKQSLTTFTRAFGPYQFDHARIIEFPSAGFAQSFPGTIPFSENVGFVRDPGTPDDDTTLDIATYVTMHELGHQYFGHQVLPARVKGFNVLSEGLTEHAAFEAYEDAYGWARARTLLENRQIRDYLTSRTMDADAEPALIDADDERYLHYSKPAWVLWGLKHYIGAEAVNAALAGLIDTYAFQGPPYPTTHDLVSALRAAAGPDYDQLITDYWERITFWDLSVEGDVSRSGNVATLTLVTDKRIADPETGRETSVTEIDEPLSEWVEVATYAGDPKRTGYADWLSLQRLKITEAETDLTLDLPDGATHLVLDPHRLLTERTYDDNTIEIADPVPGSGPS